MIIDEYQCILENISDFNDKLKAQNNKLKSFEIKKSTLQQDLNSLKTEKTN